MERLFLYVRPRLISRFESAAWEIGRSNSSIISSRVMSGVSLIFDMTLPIVSKLTSGFLPLFGGSGPERPVALYFLHTRHTVWRHTNSHSAMSALLFPASMCLIMSALFSSDIGFAICNLLSDHI
jgi:hypothetical protein